jgi:hypothetical protein
MPAGKVKTMAIAVPNVTGLPIYLAQSILASTDDGAGMPGFILYVNDGSGPRDIEPADDDKWIGSQNPAAMSFVSTQAVEVTLITGPIGGWVGVPYP